MRRLLAYAVAASVATIAPVPASLAANTVTAESIGLSFNQDGQSAFILAVCVVRASGVPSSTVSFCEIVGLEPNRMASPAPIAIAEVDGHQLTPVYVCARGYAVYRDATTTWADPDCARYA